MKRLIFVFWACCCLLACEQTPANDEKLYLFLGHPYDWNYPNRIDQRLLELDLTAFEQLWLGGDVCGSLTKDRSAFVHLDTVLTTPREKLHWAWGNHDVRFDNEDYITDFTGRNSFYTTTTDGICLLVLNTNLFFVYPGEVSQNRCEEKVRQQQLVENVLDTISASSHLVVLHHVGLLNEHKIAANGDTLMPFNINPMPIRMNCDSSSFVSDWLLPQLEAATARGVEVVFVGGDLGMVEKKFEYELSPTITLLGSGLNNSLDTVKNGAPAYVTNYNKDEVLLFTHHPKDRTLDWEFVLLDSLLHEFPKR